jgi:hypothetical protein
MKKHYLFSIFVFILMGCTLPSSTEGSSSLTSSSSSASAIIPVETKWLTPLGIQANTYNQTKPTIPTSLSSRGVIDMIHVQSQVDDELVGLAFEARVRGINGNFTFRLGILNGNFGGFQIVSHSEHGTFGERVFNALRDGLAGKTVTYENILLTYVEQQLNTQTARVTETLNEMMPSIAAMIDYFDATITA